MAFCDVRLTWTQRRRIHFALISVVAINALGGVILFLMGLFGARSIADILPDSDRETFDWVFAILTTYGAYIILHNVMGMKLCRNYFHRAEGKRMNLRLFLWTCSGLIAASVGFYLAMLGPGTSERLIFRIRRSLFEGIRRYLSDGRWKRTMDRLQIGLECCGVDAMDDWHRTYWLRRDLLDLDEPSVLEYAELDGRLMPPVWPWSCCRIDVKGPCYHDPFQLPNPEHDSAYDSLNTLGCLVVVRATVGACLASIQATLAFIGLLQIAVILLSRMDFTSARNAVALGDRRGPSPGWLFGRLDFGNGTGPNLCQIDQRGRTEED